MGKAISKSKDPVQATEFINFLVAFKFREPSAHTAVCIKILSSTCWPWEISNFRFRQATEGVLCLVTNLMEITHKKGLSCN